MSKDELWKRFYPGMYPLGTTGTFRFAGGGLEVLESSIKPPEEPVTVTFGVTPRNRDFYGVEVRFADVPLVLQAIHRSEALVLACAEEIAKRLGVALKVRQ